MFWRGVWGYLPANIAQGLAGFAAIFLFTRLLTPEEYGRYALAYSVVTLAHVMVFTWLEAAMARFRAAETTDAGIASHFASLYRAAFVLSAGFLPIAGVVVWLLPLGLSLKIALAAGLVGVPVRCLVKLAQERFRAEGQVARSARLDMATVIGGLVAGIAFAVLGLGGAAPHAGLALAPLVILPFILPGEWRQGRSARLDPVRLKSYAVYGYPVAVGLILAVVLASTDRFVLAAFMDEQAVGAYHAGYSIANRTLDVLFLWLGTAGQPALVMALERGGIDKLKTAAREQAATFYLIGLPAAAGVALVARPLGEVMIGEDLRQAAVMITPWIALSALLYGLTTYYFGQAFTLARRTKLLLATMLIPALTNVALNLILVPRFGIIGAAWSTAASFALGIICAVMIGRRFLPMPLATDQFLRCLIATAAMSAVVFSLPPIGGLVELMMDASVGALVYALVAFALNASGVRDTGRNIVARLRDRGSTI